MSVPTLSVVIPARNASGHIEQTLKTVINEVGGQTTLQLVVVDDGSSDNTFEVVCRVMGEYLNTSWVAIELAKNLGQSAATAVGLSHASNDVIVTLDDDLTDPPREIFPLVAGLSDNLDFVVGARHGFRRGTHRRVATKLIQWLAIKLYATPSNFQFSSFVAYRRDFISRLNLENVRVDIPGWAYRCTEKYSNVTVNTGPSLRLKSNYRLRNLMKLAKPFLSPLVLRLAHTLQFVSMLLVFVALFLAIFYFSQSLINSDLLPGFPTVYILLFTNLALSSFTLSFVLALTLRVHGLQYFRLFYAQRTVREFSVEPK